MRVLENQQKIAAELARARQPQSDHQMQMPLIAEVKASAASKQRPRRARGNGKPGQSGFDGF
ncbi:MAG TPA: hypothetical protein VL614_07885 [Acetobacteraceae bacterium]|nr:hypothetical protein [Acetobacteraceae bacterium]